ncbi:nitrous oxide reductase accessory protein NosL [Pseudomonadota bacterium]
MVKFSFRAAIFVLIAVLSLAGCGEKEGASVADTPHDLTREEVCMIDGMILMDYPGPKGQLFLKNGEARFFCDTKGLISTLYDPDYQVKIKRAYVQDFSGRKWGSYSDRWIDVNQAFLVLGSAKFGAMGPTIATFGLRGDADAFAAEHGGDVMPFAEFDEGMLEDYLKGVRQQLRELTDLTSTGDSPEPREQVLHQHDKGHKQE